MGSIPPIDPIAWRVPPLKFLVKKRYNWAVIAQTTVLPAKLPRIIVYLPEEVKSDLERFAKSHDRSVSNMVWH
ncbi:ribbon-helix-helix domain-containing protein [Microcoleus sp. N9_B4]|uniref:ribbon-helix-helix domain-containing protein n=1 Tax=Microcoleus sp. N9_B4 TaxID=3055386 RepID=UPI002FCF1036